MSSSASRSSKEPSLAASQASSRHTFHRWNLRRPKTASSADDAGARKTFDDVFVGHNWGRDAARLEGWAAEGERPRTPFGKALPAFHSANLEPLDAPESTVHVADPDKPSAAFSTLSQRTPMERMLPGSRGQPPPRLSPSQRRPDRLLDTSSLRIFPPPLHSSLSRPLSSVGRQGPTVLMTQNNGVTLVSKGDAQGGRFHHFDSVSTDELLQPGSGSVAGGWGGVSGSVASSSNGGGGAAVGLHGSLCSSTLGLTRPWSPPTLGGAHGDPRSTVPQHCAEALACSRVFNDPLPRFPPTRLASPTYGRLREGACVVRDGGRPSQCFANTGRKAPVIGDTSAAPRGEGVEDEAKPKLELDVGGGIGGSSKKSYGSPTSVAFDVGGGGGIHGGGIGVKDPGRPSAVFMSPVYGGW